MPVIANLVVGSDGSTRASGGSRPISSAIDREQFLARRRTHDSIIVGARTAMNHDYDFSPCPVIVLSRSRPALLDRNPQALWWNLSPADAIAQAKREFGDEVGVEAGPTLLLEFLRLNLVEILLISVTPFVGGDANVDLQTLLSFFTKVERSTKEDTIFYRCSRPVGLATLE